MRLQCLVRKPAEPVAVLVYPWHSGGVLELQAPPRISTGAGSTAVGLVEVGHFTDRGVQFRGERLGVIVLQRSNVDLF
jgi:hypothetical protein